MVRLTHFYVLCTGQPVQAEPSIEAKLHNFLFENYNPNARPVLESTDSIDLKFDIALRQILKIVCLLLIPSSFFFLLEQKSPKKIKISQSKVRFYYLS